MFWRQRTLIELEKSKRSYLLNERPYPVAEIVRRMVRVKVKYSASSDFHEQTLLRGEYKYFSGKLVDLRGAQLGDMIAYVEMGAAFGFWDSSQIDRIMDELTLHLSNMNSNQLMHLLVAISGVRKHQSRLYQIVAAALVPLVDDMAFEDAALLVKCCEVDDPPPLLESLFARLASELGRVSARTAIAALSAMTCVPKSIQLHYEVLIQELKCVIVDEVQQARLDDGECSTSPQGGNEDGTTTVTDHTALTLVDLATVSEALVALETFDLTTRECLMRAFVFRLKEACPRSLAMMLYACDSQDLARVAEGRVLHHLMRFSTEELYAVTKVYLKSLSDISKILSRQRLRGTSKSTSGSQTDALVHGAVILSSNPPRSSTTTTLLDDLSGDEALPITLEERNAAEARRRELVRVVHDLLHQLLQHVQSSTAQAHPDIYLGLLRCCADGTAEENELLGGSSILRQTVHAVCSKMVSLAREMSLDQLVEFLILSSSLGRLSLHASVVAIMDVMRSRVAAAVVQRSREQSRDVFGVSSSEAAILYNTLAELTGFNALQRRKLDADILPLLRRCVGEDAASSLRQ